MNSITHTKSESTKEEAIKVSIAATLEEKRAVYRLRYNIYAEEIAFKLESVDHQNKLFYDEMDEEAILLYAHVGSKIIGTGRINIGKLADFSPDVVQIYRMDKFKTFYNQEEDPNFAVASKGMIAQEYRSSSALTLIMAKLYSLYCDYKVQFAFIDCNFHLIPLHEHYGSRRIDTNSLYPSLGPQASLVMLVDDVQYLQTVGSPLFHIACKRTSLNNKVIGWFNSEFYREIKAIVNSQLVTTEELWSTISQYLGGMPNHSIPILKGLSVPEAALFLHCCSTIVHCHAGDYITMGSNISQELIVLLSGTAKSSLLGTILPGQTCGNNGLANRTTHSSSVIAVNDSHILVLSFHYFKKFIKSHPTIARKILNNLKRSELVQLKLNALDMFTIDYMLSLK
jgi:hypothetical protein